MPQANESRRAMADAVGTDRYTCVLLELTRQVWHPECTFETALDHICRAAARTLGVARVNVWRIDHASRRLACLHAYDARADASVPPGELEDLALDPTYASELDQVRVVTFSDVEAGAEAGPASLDWLTYFRRHGICSLMDAPVFVEGELEGVICHEHVGEPREWNERERAFAGSMGDFVAMAHEIVRRRAAEREVHHLRLHDRTTDLPNRDFLIEALAQRLHLPRASDAAPAIVHLKVTLPHGAPLPAQAETMEDLMAEVAARLRRRADAGVQVARVRDDGFAAVPAAGWTERDVVRLAEQCVQLTASPMGSAGVVRVLASVGVAFAEPDEDDARGLMRKAEQAAERALDEGNGRYQVYDVEHHESLARRLEREVALWRAFELGEFEVHYQPEVCLRDGRWRAAEALLRWRHDGRLVAAGEFIDVVEACGLVVPLGAWVLEQACRDAADWPAAEGAGTPAPVVRVNLGARQFEAPGLVDMVSTCLAMSGLAPQRLCLEITETTLVRDVASATEIVGRLRSLGVAVAIDDFGTGYSSFLHLKRFTVDAIKVDRGFVAGIPDDPVDNAIVRAVRALASALDIEVVVEGVERQAQADWLLAQDLTRAQGFLFAPALPLAELLRRYG